MELLSVPYTKPNSYIPHLFAKRDCLVLVTRDFLDSQTITTTPTNSATISLSLSATSSNTSTFSDSFTLNYSDTKTLSFSQSVSPTATVTYPSPTPSTSPMLSSSDRLYVSDDDGSEWRKKVLTIAVPGVVGLAILFGVVVAVKHATGCVMATTSATAATAEAPPPPPSTSTAPF